MIHKISHVSLIVPDQDEALAWYTDKLGFTVRTDRPFSGQGEGRWVTMCLPEQKELEVVLEPPEWGSSDGQTGRADLIGKGPGFILVSDDCRGDYETLKARGVRFLDQPTEMPWGISCFFADLYGNIHTLLQPSS